MALGCVATAALTFARSAITRRGSTAPHSQHGLARFANAVNPLRGLARASLAQRLEHQREDSWRNLVAVGVDVLEHALDQFADWDEFVRAHAAG